MPSIEKVMTTDDDRMVVYVGIPRELLERFDRLCKIERRSRTAQIVHLMDRYVAAYPEAGQR